MVRRAEESQVWLIASALIGVAGIALGALLSHWFETGREREVRERASSLERIAFYQQLKVRLDASHAAFNNQVALRDRIVQSLNRKYGP